MSYIKNTNLIEQFIIELSAIFREWVGIIIMSSIDETNKLKALSCKMLLNLSLSNPLYAEIACMDILLEGQAELLKFVKLKEKVDTNV